MARRTLRALDSRIKKETIKEASRVRSASVSTKTIAKSLKISEPTIYIHFKSKENLLYESYLYAKDEVERKEKDLLDEYLKSERKESDTLSFLRSLVNLEGVAEDYLLFKLHYEDEFKKERDDALLRLVYSSLSSKKEGEGLFLFFIPLLQEKAKRREIEEANLLPIVKSF